MPGRVNSKTWQRVVVILALALILILALALYLRLKFVFAIDHPALKDYSADAYNYDIMVRQFLDKGFLGYMSDKPNAYVTPGYPLFLALLYKLFGYSQGSPLQAVRVVQALSSTLTVFFLYLIGKEIKNWRVGLMAALLAALYPTFVWAPTLLLTEVIYTFFFILYIYSQVVCLKKPGLFKALLTGVIFGIAVLIRPAAAPLVVIPYLYDYYKNKDWLASFRGLAGTMAGLVLVLLPWWIRNLVTLHQLIFLATQTWNPLLGGAFPYFRGMEENISRFHSTQDVLKFIIQGFLTQPLLYLKWFTIGKFQIIFESMWYDLDARYQYLRSLSLLHHFIVDLGWLGAFLAIRQECIRLLSIFVFLLTAIQLMFIPTSRYAFTIMPLLIILASYVLDFLFWQEKEQPRRIER